MRSTIVALCILAAALAGCAASSLPGGAPASSDNGGVAREPMQLHALAVGVCPTPPPSLLGGVLGLVGLTAECSSEQRIDLPPLLNILGLQIGSIPGYQPAELQSAYGLPSKSAGAGETIAIVIPYDDPNAESDLATYRSKFGLPACHSSTGCFHKYAMNGGTVLPAGSQQWGEELSIDLDMVSAICPNCHIDIVESADDTPANLLTALTTAATKLHANVISNSWLTSESAAYVAIEPQLQALNATIVAASGDSGYGATWPASSQYVIAVGGTTLNTDTSTSRGWSETVWSGTGGGCSAYIAKPSWQTDAGCSNRTMNDVSAVADPNPGVAVYDTYMPLLKGGWLVFGGTSVATPIVAGAIALSGGTAAINGSYIAKHASALNAVRGGSNGTCTAAYLCSGGPGYSGPAGFGSPNGVGAF